MIIQINDTILLRPLTLNDVEDIFSYSNHPEFCKYLTFQPSSSKQPTIDFVQNILNETILAQRVYWGIDYQQHIIGTIGFLNINTKSKKAELGFGLSHEFWGKGIMFDCIKAVISHASQYNIHTLEICTDKLNTNAISLINKLHFQPIQTTQQQECLCFSKNLSY